MCKLYLRWTQEYNSLWIADSLRLLMPVMLSAEWNTYGSGETIRCAQGDD